MNDEIPYPVPPRSWLEIDNLVEAYLLEHLPETLRSPQPTNARYLLEVCFSETHDVAVGLDRELPRSIEASLNALTGVVDVGLETWEGIELDKPRARFTYCHEAGHALLHMKYIRQNAFSLARTTPRKVERFSQPEPQANQAAGAFMMPRRTFVPEYRRLAGVGTDDWLLMASLKNTYRCSEEALERRIGWLKKAGFL